MELGQSAKSARYIVPLGAAFLLTFGRTGFLSFAGRYTSLDLIVNVFLVLIAAPVAMFAMVRNLNGSQILKYLPIIALGSWLGVRGLLLTSGEYAPNRTVLLTCCAGIILGSNIMRWELPRLRRSLLVLSLIFTLLVCVFERSVLVDVAGSGLSWRLEGGVSPAVFVAFPRVVYTLVIVGLASAIIEKNVMVRGLSAVLMIVPILLGFATAGRGGLLGLAVATLVFTLGLPVVLRLRRKFVLLFATVSVTVSVYIAYEVVIRYFPFLVQRIVTEDNSNRFTIWAEAFQNISLFGRGPGDSYAHNVFLESLQDYGIVGLILVVVVLATSFRQLLKAWRWRADLELLWVTAVIALQFTCQQFSLDIYWGFFWTAMVLPLGLNIGSQANVNASSMSCSVGKRFLDPRRIGAYAKRIVVVYR